MTRRFYAFPYFSVICGDFFTCPRPSPCALMPHMKKPADNVSTLLELVGVPEDLNAKAIAEDFLGLSREAAQRMFEEYGSDFKIRYGEDLMFMAEKGLTLPSMSIRDIGGWKNIGLPCRHHHAAEEVVERGGVRCGERAPIGG